MDYDKTVNTIDKIVQWTCKAAFIYLGFLSLRILYIYLVAQATLVGSSSTEDDWRPQTTQCRT